MTNKTTEPLLPTSTSQDTSSNKCCRGSACLVLLACLGAIFTSGLEPNETYRCEPDGKLGDLEKVGIDNNNLKCSYKNDTSVQTADEPLYPGDSKMWGNHSRWGIWECPRNDDKKYTPTEIARYCTATKGA